MASSFKTNQKRVSFQVLNDQRYNQGQVMNKSLSTSFVDEKISDTRSKMNASPFLTNIS